MYKRWIVIAWILLCLFVWYSSLQPAVMKVQSDEKTVVVIDPGHGGKDQGASREGIYEEDINFAVSLYLKQFLETCGLTVMMTRTSDVDLASVDSTHRKREDLKRRVEIMNMGTVFISIHMNINLDTSIIGSQVFYGKGKEASEEFANAVQSRFIEFNGSTFTPRVGDYYVLNETTSVGILIEGGFLSNHEERKQLVNAQYQQQMAYSLCLGILDYLQLQL